MLFQLLDLNRLNSATKYPSILTYHRMADKGCLSEELSFPVPTGNLRYSEKIDGTNTRLIVNSEGDFIVGSRNDLLWFSGDLLHNPAQSIVDVVREIAFGMEEPDEGFVRVYYGESYGGKISSQSKQYTNTGEVDFKLFDVVEFTEDELHDILSKSPEEIALWRENGGQPFWTHEQLEDLGFPLAPRLPFDGALPTDHQEVLDWLQGILPKTQCLLDPAGKGEPEGVIVRNDDRSFIVKIRYQDYQRTLKQRMRR